VAVGRPVASVLRLEPEAEVRTVRYRQERRPTPPPGSGEADSRARRGAPEPRPERDTGERRDPRAPPIEPIGARRAVETGARHAIGRHCLTVPTGRAADRWSRGPLLPSTDVAQPAAARRVDVAALFDALLHNVERVIQGKRDQISLALVCLLAEGHLLVEDVPGVGKTSLAKAIARSLSASANRIQFTPDLLPSDVVGVSVWNRGTNEFEFRPGGVFAHVVLADEINRASPKTQSALLEAMEERQVTVDARTYALPRPFLVIATQNPIELEGTYPLPEAQLDRFLMRLPMGYPSRDAEIAILETHGSGHVRVDALEPVASAADVAAAAEAVTMVHVANPIQHYIVELAEATRAHPDLVLGVSPRGALALQRAARAFAASSGRDYVIPDDVKLLAPSVLEHRVIVTPEAGLRGVDGVEVIRAVVAAVRVPGAVG